jgi:hypothetical protein
MKRCRRRDPKTRAEWQEAVDAAAAARAVADCIMYGLLTPGLTINVARCDEILERGRSRGVTPSRPVVELAAEFVEAYNLELANPTGII